MSYETKALLIAALSLGLLASAAILLFLRLGLEL